MIPTWLRNQVGPIISGPMAYHVGWPNFWWLNVALFAVLIILLIFFFPETKWHREQLLEADTFTPPPAEQLQTPLNPKDEITRPTEVESTKNEVEPVDEWLHRGSPSKSQFNFWKLSPEPVKTMAITLWIPWKLHFFPIVEFAAFVVSWSASVFLTVNLTQSQVFAAPPYNWSSQSIGFTNFASFIGALIGLATNGPLSDWISMRATRKNNGVREPEMRLPAMIPYVLIAILGNFIVAYGYQNSWDWRVSPLSHYKYKLALFADMKYRLLSSSVTPVLVLRSLLFLPSLVPTLSIATNPSPGLSS